MATRYIGVIYYKDTKEIISVFNPAYAKQFKDPRLTLDYHGRERGLLKIPRGNFPEVATPAYVPEVIEKAQKILKGL